MASSNQVIHMKLCRNGNECSYLKKGFCKFIHHISNDNSNELNSLIEKSNYYATQRMLSIRQPENNVNQSRVLQEEKLKRDRIELDWKVELINDREEELKRDRMGLIWRENKLESEKKEFQTAIENFKKEKLFFENDLRKKQNRLNRQIEETYYDSYNYQQMIKEHSTFNSKDIDFQNYESRINKITEPYLCEICMTPVQDLIDNEETVVNEINKFKILKCGHSLCNNCCGHLPLEESHIKCPKCREYTNILDIKTNYLAESVLNISKNIIATNAIVIKKLKENEILKTEI